eukprot:TRINITY_DN19119_c0_g1_i1.p1 TRINITY_DN19119_c0_g1~~TRINITY_DN19119_c0_g1_i1.p1  ORF type:complete len:986 (+),score=90.98 TRINITY_DN19119_c0_g1_i1:425-2959(+)
MKRQHSKQAPAPKKSSAPTVADIDVCFATILEKLGGGSLTLQDEFAFIYKKRPASGHAIHVAALHKRGDEVLQDLLDLGADVNDRCVYPSWGGKEASVVPLHLAAAQGSVNVLQSLLVARADIAAKATYDGKPSYEAIHEAAFARNVEAIGFLIEHQANVNSTNNDGNSALHLAAKVGSVEVAQLLVDSNADTSRANGCEQSALILALDADSFPQEHLHILLGSSISAIVDVARRCPGIAANMLHRAQLQLHDVTTESWVELMTFAPQAAEAILDAVCALPQVQDANHHPLPRRARLRRGEITCHYGSTDTWQFDLQWTPAYPEWHLLFVPGLEQRRRRFFSRSHMTLWKQSLVGQRGEDLVDVQVKVVKLPGVMCPRVLYALAKTQHEHIFAKMATQGILQYAWRHVRMRFTLLLLQRVAKLLSLIYITLSPTIQHPLVNRTTWSVVVGSAMYEAFVNMFEAINHCRVLGEPFKILLRAPLWFDLFMICLTLNLGFVTAERCDLRSSLNLLAVASFYQWWHVLFTLRGFELFGRRIMPILQSFKSMISIGVITLLIFLSFLQFYVVITERFLTDDGLSKVMFEVFRTLLVGDSDGMKWMLVLGENHYGRYFTWFFLIAELFIFYIAVMNLFIAVQGEAYDRAQEHTKAIFAQARAQICIRSFLLPYLPSGRRWRMAAIVLIVIFALCWFILIPRKVHVVWPFSSLVLAMLLGDMCLLQRPWREVSKVDKGREGTVSDNLLWICHGADWEEDREILNMCDEVSRFSGIRQSIFSAAGDTLQQVQELRSVVERHGQALQKQADQLELVGRTFDQRMTKLEERVTDSFETVLSRLAQIERAIQASR